MDGCHERIHRTAKSSEIVHVDGPDHSTEVFFLLQEVHLVNDTVSVLVADPLSILKQEMLIQITQINETLANYVKREKQANDLMKVNKAFIQFDENKILI